MKKNTSYLNTKKNNMFCMTTAKSLQRLLYRRQNHTELGLLKNTCCMAHIQLTDSFTKAFWILQKHKINTTQSYNIKWW